MTKVGQKLPQATFPLATSQCLVMMMMMMIRVVLNMMMMIPLEGRSITAGWDSNEVSCPKIFCLTTTNHQTWIRSLIKYVQLTMSHQQTTNLQKCVAILSKKKLKIFSSSLILQVLALSFNPYFLLIQIFFFSIFSFYPDFILSIFSFNPYWRIFQIEHSIGSITNTVQSIYLKSVVRRKIKKRTSNLMIWDI